MNRIDRLFGITTMLQSKRYVQADKIAEQFGISVRTVYRDIKALCEQGIPVSFEQSRGYFLVQGYFLPPVSFTQEEANALLLMEKIIVGGFADKSILAHYTTVLNKVKAVMRSGEKDRFEQLNNHMKVHVPECLAADFDYLATLQSAISHKQIIEVEYCNVGGTGSLRRVEPIGLVFYGAAWHMIAWCYLRNEYRDFKVARIQRLSATGLPFKREPHTTLTDYIAGLQLANSRVM